MKQQLRKTILQPLMNYSFMILVTAPARATSQALLDKNDITLRDDSDDDVTTEEPFLKKCIVDGNFYSHGKTVSDKIY